MVAKKKPIWPIKLTIVLVLVTLLAFLPWESIFSVEFKPDYFQRVVVGGIGLGGFFILLCIVMFSLLRYDRWFSGLAVLVIPCFLMLVAFLFVLNLIAPNANWQDEAVYRSGNDYIVLESIEYKDLIESRIIRTTAPYNKLRRVEELRFLSADDNWFVGDNIRYKGKLWYKQTVKGKGQ